MCIFLIKGIMGVNEALWAWGFGILGRLGCLGLVSGLWGFWPRISFETEIQQATEAKQLD